MPLLALLTFAVDPVVPWWEHLLHQVAETVIFGGLGIMLAIIGFKLFDYFTPGDLEEEILKKQNHAAAILGAAIILGICLILSRIVGA